MKQLLSVVLACLGLAALTAQTRIDLWPVNYLPNSRHLALEDSVANERAYRVVRPRLYHYAPAARQDSSAAVIIIPGGGYARLAYEVSGNMLAQWFAAHGVHGFVLWHRLPDSPDLIRRDIAPLQDAQRAVRLIRSHAIEWGIDPHKVGVMGCSAGGHLASTVGTHGEDVSRITDALDKIPFRPDFMILVSPVISMDAAITHRGSRDNLLGVNASQELLQAYSNDTRVDAQTPPAIMIHADNDPSVSPLNSIRFYTSMKQNGRAASLHIFPQGKHSISLEPQPGTTQAWSELTLGWLREMGFLE